MRNVPLAAVLFLTCAACSLENTLTPSCAADAAAPITVTITPADACELMDTQGQNLDMKTCESICGINYSTCSLPLEYVNIYKTLKPSAATADGGFVDPTYCPMITTPVGVKCDRDCF